MSRKQKRQYDNSQRQESAIAGPCTACQALLPLANPPRQQRTAVYSIKGQIRYCRCDNCGNTWKRIVEVKSVDG
jgi:hypothetical protein